MKSSTISIVTALILPVSLAGITTTSAQLAPVRIMPFAEHIEKYDNPPAPPRKIETSPRMISQFGVFTSYQVNVNANHQNIIGDAANECVIAVDPTDGNKMTIVWRQFNDVTSNFRQGGWGYTTDAGITWTFPGVLENNVFRSDPVTKSDETGQFFYLSLQSTQQQSFFCDDLWRSTNGGQSWRGSRLMKPGMEATRNGSLSIRTSAGWVTDSSTSFGPASLLVTLGNSTVRRTAGPP